MTASNRTLVSDYYTALWSGDLDAAMRRHLADDYIEHQYTAGFSRDGLASYVRERRAAHPDHRMTIRHSLSEDDLVFLFAEENLGAGEDFARADLFRVADGRIAEHWAAHVRDEKNRKNPHTTFGGPQVDRRVDHAARHADRLEGLDSKGFGEQQLEAFRESRPQDYIQHSPKGADGHDGLVNLLTKMKESGIKMSMTRKRTLRDGDFWVSHRLYDSEPKHPLVNRINTFDMFRIDAQGRAAEHWDVMEDVPSADMLDRVF